VVWVQHSDDELVKDTLGWEYVAELQSAQGESVIHKRFGDAAGAGFVTSSTKVKYSLSIEALCASI
jgi:hypothetical protein